MDLYEISPLEGGGAPQEGGRAGKGKNKTMTNSPFEQFEIIRLLPIHPFGNFDISVTNSTLFMLIAASFFLFIVNMEKGLLIPTR